MTAPDLQILHDSLAAAAAPEQVFGPLTGSRDTMHATLTSVFRKMALIAHPDRCPASTALATRTFQLLESWRRRAERRILAGLYGTPHTPAAAPVVITTRKDTYSVGAAVAQGDYYTLHVCRQNANPADLVLKIIRQPCDNDLAENEVRILRALADADAARRPYFPHMVDAFLSTDGATRRRALIYTVPPASYRLNDIRRAFPAGIDPRDAAWMFNRLLEALWFVHREGLVHGAVLPDNLLVDIHQHGLLLCEYAYAVPIGNPPTALSGSHAAWYPPETAARTSATPASDIFLAARCLIYILGGAPLSGQVPPAVPPPIQRFLRGSLIPAPARRPTDAGALREEFDDCLAGLYGKRAFRPFAMPADAEPAFGSVP